MAKAKDEKPIKLAPAKAAAALAEKVEPELRRLMADNPAGAAPEGVQAGLGDFGAKLKKALPQIITGLMEVGAIAADGQVSADEVQAIAGRIFELIRGRKPAPA